jgi:hypothetical protein
MSYSRIRKLEEQAGKRTPLTTNNIMSPHGRFGLTGLGHFADIIAPFSKKTIQH